jgi:basic membrane lipoprotein Med (substrate-binding protein (PBP1-ABC) superfamily)/DNA-binding SARP family transcriptional activator/tRNA A-37 threonylcarbamoyl transferase component Bud32
MEFRILGPVEVSAGDGAIKLGGPKQRAVLAHLILRANHPVPVDLLIDGLWGDEPPGTAKNTLQTYVYRLRQVLGEDRITSGSGGYVLHAETEEIDAARFEAMVRSAKAEIRTDPARAADELGDALALWRGPPLSDLSEEPSLRGEIARLEELHLSATEHRISAEIAMGGHSTVVSELDALTARYPLRERMWANLMLALYRLGRQAEALAAYQRARQVLAEELGAEPSAELQHLHEKILRGDPELGGREAPERPAVRPSRVDLQPGTQVASYRILRTLGRGGMSVVYVAEHEWLQRKVALKVLAPQLADDDRFRDRFVRESRLAASLDHPNVIPIYEAGAWGEDLFIAMRFVEGSDLRTVLREGALEPGRAIGILRQVASALDAAHEQGLVHRDIKPANVLLVRPRTSQPVEHVYLSDFGLTKRSASDSAVTGTGQFVGTFDYAAPEQFTGETLGARTDVYSLGCVLFECLTGRPPFRSENDASLMYAHLQEPPPLVTGERPDLPHEIDRVVGRAMAKSQDDRPRSAGELAADAARALGAELPPRAALLIEPGEDPYQSLLVQGVDRAVSEFDLDAEKVPAALALMEQQLHRLSEDGVDLILVEPGLVEVNAVAGDFPDTRYVAIDFTGQLDRSLANVSYLSFAQNEGSFLVGAAAALESRTGRIGFIGGMDIPMMHEFQAGYEAGARAVNPSIEVRTIYLTPYFDFSGFRSPTYAFHLATDMYRWGADVIYHAASASGRGVFQAAAEIRDRHVWAIGVDVDQYQEFAAVDPKDSPPELHIAAWPSHVLTSMVKRVDVAVYEVLRDHSRGTFTSGVRRLGLAEGGVDIAYSGGFIDDIRPQIEDLRSQIIAGDIAVPSRRAEDRARGVEPDARMRFS